MVRRAKPSTVAENESKRADLYGRGRGRKKERSPVEVTLKQTEKSLELGRRAGSSIPEARKESRALKVSTNRTHLDEERPMRKKREKNRYQLRRV